MALDSTCLYQVSGVATRQMSYATSPGYVLHVDASYERRSDPQACHITMRTFYARLLPARLDFHES